MATKKEPIKAGDAAGHGSLFTAYENSDSHYGSRVKVP